MELDDEMASLTINEKKRRLSSNSDESNTETTRKSTEVKLRRSTRKRLCRQFSEKRRVETKPKKYDIKNFRNIESYYLDKRIKRNPSSLETIYEEPKSDGDAGSLMSTRKFKRTINMAAADKIKIKKRGMKAKKVYGYKKVGVNRISKEAMEEFIKQLEDLEDESD